MESDSSYNPDANESDAVDGLLEKFAENWVLSSDRDDTISLFFVLYHLVHTINIPKTKAAYFACMMFGNPIVLLS